jgi:hypothetical protein
MQLSWLSTCEQKRTSTNRQSPPKSSKMTQKRHPGVTLPLPKEPCSAVIEHDLANGLFGDRAP